MFGSVALVDRIERRSGTQGPYARLTLSMEGGEERRVFFAPTDEAEEEPIPCLLRLIEKGVVREGTRLLFHVSPDNNEWFRWRGYKDRFGLWKKGPGVSVNVDRLVPVYEAVPYCRLKGFVSGRLGMEEVTSERSTMGIVRHRILQRHWRLLWNELARGGDPASALASARRGTEDFIEVLAGELRIPGLTEEAVTTLSTCEEVSNEIMEWSGGQGYFCSEYNMLSNRMGLVGRADFVGVRKERLSEGRIIEYKITDHAVNFEHRRSWGSVRALLQAGVYSALFREAVRLPRASAEVWVFDKWTGARAFQHRCEDNESEDLLRRALWARDEYLYTVSSSTPDLQDYGKSRCQNCSFKRVCKALTTYKPDAFLSDVRDGLDLEAEAGWRILQPIEDLFEDGLVVPKSDIVQYTEDELQVRVGNVGNLEARPGSFVRFSPIESTHGWGFGVVKGMEGDRLTVALRDPLTPAVLSEGRLRLDFSMPVDFSRRAKMAITAVEMPEAVSDDPELRSHLESLRKAVESAGSLEASATECTLDRLNESQQEAARMMLGSKLTVIHGPFGSGKTTVIARASIEMAKAGNKILITSYTNNAVDNAMALIAEMAQEEGVEIDMVRVATQGRGEEIPGITIVDPRNHGVEEIQMLREADVVGSTLISCLSDAFKNAFMEQAGYLRLKYLPFEICIVDEASQCVLPYALIPCLLSRRWVLVGDHKQLEPLVLDQRAARSLTSWFDLAVRDLEEVGGVVMLDVQYRCPHEVGAYLSRQFYESKLRNDEGGESHDHSPVELDPEPASIAINTSLAKAGIDARMSPEALTSILDPSHHLVFIDTAGRSPERGRRSKSNTGEAIVASEILKLISAATDDLLFLSPYHAQNRLLRRLLREDLRMGTVDSYQGRQSDVVVLSLVRSNANGLLGFLRNVRRLNVAMSRCMKKLIVISDSTTIRMNRADLEAREALMEYMRAARELGTYISLAPERQIPSRIRRRGLAPRTRR